jgi:hypothetical protein
MRPHGAARAAATAPRPSLTLPLRYGRADAGRLARKRNDLMAAIMSEARSRGGFDKGTLAMAQIGLTRGGPEVRPIAKTAYGPSPLVKSAALSARS